MKRIRMLLSLLLVFVLLLSLMPAAFAAPECPYSPDGYHHYSGYIYVGSWLSPCVWDGYRYCDCMYCGLLVELDYFTETHHNWGDWTTLTEATCTQEGLWRRTCYKCGSVETDSHLADHSYGPWTVLTEATDHSQGLREHSCGVCGHEERENFDPEGTLRRGDKGGGVTALQNLLIERGYLPHRSADGDFGEGTEAAVRVFQKDAGLTVDGVAWPQTIKMLDPSVQITAPAAGCQISMRAAAEGGGAELVLDFCEDHASLASAAAKLQPDVRRLLWTSYLDEDYETLLKGKDSAEDKAAVEKERETYMAWLAACEASLAALYPDAPDRVDALVTDQMIRHSVILCWMNHPGEPLTQVLAAGADDGSPAPLLCQQEDRTEENSLISHISMCEEHKALADAAALLPGKQAKEIWLLTWNRQVAALASEAGESKAEQEAFSAWLDAYTALVQQLRPDLPDAADKLAALALMEYVTDHCGAALR